jgi:hypothetical protein
LPFDPRPSDGFSADQPPFYPLSHRNKSRAKKKYQICLILFLIGGCRVLNRWKKKRDQLGEHCVCVCWLVSGGSSRRKSRLNWERTLFIFCLASFSCQFVRYVSISIIGNVDNKMFHILRPTNWLVGGHYTRLTFLLIVWFSIYFVSSKETVEISWRHRLCGPNLLFFPTDPPDRKFYFNSMGKLKKKT